MGCKKGKAVVYKPVYLGQTGLALNKSMMDEVHYEQKKLKYSSNIKLGYMDKYVYDIKTFSYWDLTLGNTAIKMLNCQQYLLV